MRDETREHLDGERTRADLDAAAREEADAWERLVGVLREDVPGPAPAWLEGAVMAAVTDELAAERPAAPSARLAWLLEPSLRLSPLGAGLAAAALIAALVVPWRRAVEPAAPVDIAAAPAAAPDPVVFVQFVLEAPRARSVAVAGDFNDWDDGLHELADADGDGVWTGRVPLRPGVHEYMFVVDGSDWVTDPRAERWADDGFGNRNAVMAVVPPPRAE